MNLLILIWRLYLSILNSSLMLLVSLVNALIEPRNQNFRFQQSFWNTVMEIWKSHFVPCWKKTSTIDQEPLFVAQNLSFRRNYLRVDSRDAFLSTTWHSNPYRFCIHPNKYQFCLHNLALRSFPCSESTNNYYWYYYLQLN